MAISERVSASELIQGVFCTLPVFVSARVVALYRAIDNEVETAGLISAAQQSGKVVVLPAVCDGGMQFRKVGSELPLEVGAFGIPEPSPDSPVVDIGSIDLVVVPGIAFDLEGRRIGYGKGYYDRVFHAWEGSGHLLGLCYDFQLVDRIISEPHDVEMDLILTEKRLIATRNSP